MPQGLLLDIVCFAFSIVVLLVWSCIAYTIGHFFGYVHGSQLERKKLLARFYAEQGNSDDRCLDD